MKSKIKKMGKMTYFWDKIRKKTYNKSLIQGKISDRYVLIHWNSWITNGIHC